MQQPSLCASAWAPDKVKHAPSQEGWLFFNSNALEMTDVDTQRFLTDQLQSPQWMLFQELPFIFAVQIWKMCGFIDLNKPSLDVKKVRSLLVTDYFSTNKAALWTICSLSDLLLLIWFCLVWFQLCVRLEKRPSLLLLLILFIASSIQQAC